MRSYGSFVLIENLYDHNFASFVNVVTELYSNGA